MLSSSSILLAAGSLHAQSIPSQPAGAAAKAKAAPTRPIEITTDEESRWFVRMGAVYAGYHSAAPIAANGKIIPGSTLKASNNQSITFDIGYDVTRNLSVSLMGGFPVKPTITAKGSVASLGTLGKVFYGPTILTGVYKLRRWPKFHPYIGTGVAYAIILKNYDAAVSHLVVNNNFGFVLQTGAEYRMSHKMEVFADIKQVWLAVNAHGQLSGGVPVRAHVTLNPTLVSVGIKFHFRIHLRR